MPIPGIFSKQKIQRIQIQIQKKKKKNPLLAAKTGTDNSGNWKPVLINNYNTRCSIANITVSTRSNASRNMVCPFSHDLISPFSCTTR